MDRDEENAVSSSATDASVPLSGGGKLVSPTDEISLQPAAAVASPVFSIPVIPPTDTSVILPAILTPVLPSIAPLPAPRPLAPLPVRPPVFKPPLAQNGGSRTSDSDSDLEESGPSRPATRSNQEYEISEESKQVRERQEKAVQELLMKRHAAALAVPTNDNSVRARLRHLGEPVTLFGEREMERRDRLRMLMAKLDSEDQLERLMKAHEDEEAAANAAFVEPEEDIRYPFFTEGSQALLEVRREITKYSLVKAAVRLNRARRKMDDPDENMDAEVDWTLKQAENLVLECSEIGDDRPLSGCSFSPDGNTLATCSLTGVAKLWSMPEVKLVSSLKGHTERATDVAFSPVNNLLATASADRTARLWNMQGSVVRKFEGHLDRLGRISFHPTGKYLGTASFDKTWRLWDVETGEELLLQEGHSRSVYGITFHHDGSLAASCGLDALARVWDLRSGRSILVFEGHVKPVLSISFSPNGYHLATGGEDNSCRIWDLRKRKCLSIIPAHSNLISQVKFEPQEGYFLVTSSYDMTVKIWSSRDFKPVRTLSGHESKVTSVDVVGDGQYIASVSHDRTIKLWSSRQSEKDKSMEID